MIISGDNIFWIIIIGFWATASMINRYQWRKAFEAYYKRPIASGKDHEPPIKKEEAEVVEK